MHSPVVLDDDGGYVSGGGNWIKEAGYCRNCKLMFYRDYQEKNKYTESVPDYEPMDPPRRWSIARIKYD